MNIVLPEFIRFCIIGGLLFVFDAVMLELLARSGVDVHMARLVSLGIGLQVAYIAHGLFTFRMRQRFNLRTWLGFIGANALGACLNYLVFSGTLALIGNADTTTSRLIALVAGTGVALFFNYWINRCYVFKRGNR